MRPKISIIVPVYNGASFLTATIETVCNQTYQNWELLLIDDGSTDTTASICKEYVSKDTRIRYRHKKNGGQASARNLGFELSTGNWIALLDADDLWRPAKLEKQIAAIEQDPKIQLCYTNTSAFKVEVDKEISNNDGYTYGKHNSSVLFTIIFQHNHISNSSILLKRSLINDVGFYNEQEEIRGSEDWELLLRILKTDIAVIGLEEKLLYYRLHAGGIHNQSARMLIGKTIVYSNYTNDETLPRLLKLKQYRYVYRELLNILWTEGKTSELKTQFYCFAKKDPVGFGTLKQRFLIKILPLSAFMWTSQKIVYRLAYRLEKLTYWLFLN